MMKYAAYARIFRGETLEQILNRLARYSFDGIELVGEVETPDTEKNLELITSYGLEVSDVVASYDWDLKDQRDLSNPNEKMRRRAINYYIENCVNYARDMEAPLVVLAPAWGKTSPIKPIEKEWRYMVSALKEIGSHAAGVGVQIAVEPAQRYHTYLVNSVDHALRLIKDVGLENVRIMLDTFHMNIEEKDSAAAIKRAGERLIHVHAADSNRGAIGDGHIDFKKIIEALKEIGYRRYISIEAFPFVEKMGMKYISYNFPESIDKEILDDLVKDAIEKFKFWEKRFR